jgi:hypothetical protein
MLNNCLDDTPTNPRGIYMRFAKQPWAPWSAPQTIFNPNRDNGYCYFMHRAVTSQNPIPCDNLCGPDRMTDPGRDYSPYFIPRHTTGDVVTRTPAFYFTMDTWDPYTQVIMKVTIQSTPPAAVPRSKPTTAFRFDLQQNFPNPFNPTTVVCYQLPGASGVPLAVDDILDRLVATLVNTTKPAGSYMVQFNAWGLASGEYVCRLTAGSFDQMRRMLLLK